MGNICCKLLTKNPGFGANTTVGENSILPHGGFYHAMTLPVSRTGLNEAQRHLKWLPLAMEVLVSLEEWGKEKEETAEHKWKWAYAHGFFTIERKLFAVEITKVQLSLYKMERFICQQETTIATEKLLLETRDYSTVENSNTNRELSDSSFY